MRRSTVAGTVGVLLLTVSLSSPVHAVSAPPVVGTAKPVTPTQPAGAPQDCPDIAAGNGQFLAVWEDKRHPGNDDVFGQRLDPNGDRLGAPFAISTAAGGQFCPRAASSGSAWLVVWTDARAGHSDLRGATITATGAVVPAGGFVVAAATSEQRQPSIAFDGTNFVVAWSDRRTGSWAIRATRVRPDRTVLDGAGLVVGSGAGVLRNPSVAARNGASVIAWSGGSGTRARVLRTGGFAGPAPTLGGATGWTRAAAASNRLIVSFPGSTAARLAQLDPATGRVLRTVGIAPPPSGRELDALEADGNRVALASRDAAGDSTLQTADVDGSASARVPTRQEMDYASLAVLAGGRAALTGMDPGTGRLWVVPVN